jgi:predicted nuclease of predicted toxin-antitoxin system
MRLLVDACVDVRVCNWLRERGHDALHLSEQGLERLPDGDIFRKAAAEDRCVVTFDLDFGEIAALTRGVKASVILLRIGDPGWQRVVERLSSVLAASADAVAKGAVITVEEARHRIRFLPIGTGRGGEA